MQSDNVGLHGSSISASTRFSLRFPNACQIRIVLLVMYQVEKFVSTRRAREISKESIVSERVSSLYPSSQGKIVQKLNAWKFNRNTTFDRSSNSLVTNCSAINLHKLLISLKIEQRQLKYTHVVRTQRSGAGLLNNSVSVRETQRLDLLLLKTLYFIAAFFHLCPYFQKNMRSILFHENNQCDGMKTLTQCPDFGSIVATDYFFGNLSYIQCRIQVLGHQTFLQRSPIHNSTNLLLLFIALWLQADDVMTSQLRPMSHLQFSRAILSREFSCATKLQV